MWFVEPERFRAGELAALVAKAAGAELHVVLAPQAVWRSDEAQARANAAVVELYDRHAGPPADREEPALGEVAELLSRPPEARYGWIADHVNGTKLSVLVAGTRHFGVIAVREEDDVWIRMFDRGTLSETLARVLPDFPGGDGSQPVSVLRSELRRAENPSVVASPEVRRALRFAELTPLVTAEFHVETNRAGRRARSRFPLRVYDTEAGRWAVTTRPHYDDEQWQLTPATTADVARLLENLRHELARA
jgi:hypothetical protein